MEILSYYQNLIKEKQVISKSSCYYPRLANTNKRGRIAFNELYRSVCCDEKKKLSIEDFEIFICKNKNWSVLSQPTDKGGEMSTEYILECEIGSFEDYLKKYKKKFSCDGVIWEFGYVDSKNIPIVGLGMKGLLFVELSVKESIRDAHSSLAVLIKNPAWRLVEAVKTLRKSDGKILIKNWYDDVKPFSKKDVEIIAKEPCDEKSFKKEFGLKNKKYFSRAA